MDHLTDGAAAIFVDWVDVEVAGTPWKSIPHVAMLFPSSRGEAVQYDLAFGRYSSLNNQFQLWNGETHTVAFPRYYQELK